jgi:hypothetical protein
MQLGIEIVQEIAGRKKTPDLGEIRRRKAKRVKR